MNILDLVAGASSISEVAKNLSFKTFYSDIKEVKNFNTIQEFLENIKVPFIPDVLWLSPPCNTFSVASMHYHWTGGRGAYIPKTEKSEIGIRIAKNCIEIIDYYKKLNPGLIWYIENPRGLLRKMDFMKNLKRHTVTYCQYGCDRMKPTDIWTNNEKWTPKKACKNGDPCHLSAPRGSRLGTQGLKNAYDRSIIPKNLFYEIFTQSI